MVYAVSMVEIEVFKTGTHTDSAGATRAWTTDDLDAVAAKYNNQPQGQRHEAPVVLGHPTDSAPAYGWVEGLTRKGDILTASLKGLVPEFVELVRRGMYKKRSIALYPDLTLRHVGFLGAAPPAVKGLADVRFGERGMAAVIEWSEATASSDAEENQIKGGDKDMDKDARIAELESSLRKKDADLSEAQRKGEEALAQGKAEFSEAQTKRDAELSTLKFKLDAVETETRKTGHKAFCDRLVGEGKLLPAEVPTVIDLMESMHGMVEFEFSEDDGKARRLPVDKLKALVSGLPRRIEFAEFATRTGAAGKGAADGTPAEVAGKAAAYKAEQSKLGNFISTCDAVAHVTKGGSK